MSDDLRDPPATSESEKEVHRLVVEARNELHAKIKKVWPGSFAVATFAFLPEGSHQASSFKSNAGFRAAIVRLASKWENEDLPKDKRQ